MARVIGLIPARGGSKGVKRKNIRLLNGKPLIAYAIQAAQQSRYLSELYVTTDDAEIADVARLFGVTVIERPSALATDDANMVDVVLHGLNEVCPKPSNDDIFCLMQPTCPFRTVGEIDESIEKLHVNDANAVVGVTRALHEHPERFYQIETGYLKPLMPEYLGRNRQELPEFLIRNGTIYTLRVKNFIKNQCFSPEKSIPLEIPPNHALNIDEEDDFLAAEFYISREINRV